MEPWLDKTSFLLSRNVSPRRFKDTAGSMHDALLFTPRLGMGWWDCAKRTEYYMTLTLYHFHSIVARFCHILTPRYNGRTPNIVIASSCWAWMIAPQSTGDCKDDGIIVRLVEAVVLHHGARKSIHVPSAIYHDLWQHINAHGRTLLHTMLLLLFRLCFVVQNNCRKVWNKLSETFRLSCLLLRT